MGFHEGLGLETTPKDHIMGGSAEVGLFSDKLQFRTIYVRGGERGSSLGISTEPIQKKGNVLGFLLTSNFFENKLVTEAEIDTSRFDPDTSDEFLAKRDKAYRIKLGGTIKDYTYEALYEYIGRDYEVIGNPGLSKDKQGYAFKAGGTLFKVHLLNLSFSSITIMLKKMISIRGLIPPRARSIIPLASLRAFPSLSVTRGPC